MASRRTRVQRTAKVLRQSQLWQVWAVPLVLTVPVTALTLWLEPGINPPGWLVVLAGFFVLVVIGGLFHLVTQIRNADDFTFGGDAPPAEDVEALVTFVSGRSFDKALVAMSGAELLPKLIDRFEPPRIVLLLSQEIRKRSTPEGSRDQFHSPEHCEEALKDALTTSRSPRCSDSEKVDGDHRCDPCSQWQDLVGGLEVQFVHAESLTTPHGERLFDSASDAVRIALGRESSRSPTKIDAAAVVADLTGGNAPATVALYEAATQELVQTTYWYSEPAGEGDDTYGEARAIAGVYKAEKHYANAAN